MDAYPPPRPDERQEPVGDEGQLADESDGSQDADDLDASAQEARLAELLDMVRRRYGGNSAVVTDEDLMIVARNFQNSERSFYAHEFREFDGDAVVMVAAEGRPANAPTAAMWSPYVSGEVIEFHLPCDHEDMTRPDMLAQVWAHMSAWLKLER
jgi:thioesterase domain-containing protein